MSRRPLLLLACLLLLLTGCTAEPDAAPAGRPASTSVDVDTAALRVLKREAGVEPCRRGTGAPLADGLPDLTLSCLGGGRPVRLSTLRGPMVVTFFAQWCAPCRKELPYYQQLHERAGKALKVVGVDFLDTQPDSALRLARRSGVTFPLLADPDARVRAPLKLRGLPSVAYVAADGTVTDVEARAFTSYAELRDAVQDQLGVDLPA